ncbi:response regulator [Candidatus Peregrinibacteria bacterium]|nr:response regulator [Candidatus Peregrinibacteria bacterium]
MTKTQHPKVLIVEDDSQVQGGIVRAFEKIGFDVVVSNEGMEGIVQTVEMKPDVVVLDLLMPQVDGYEYISAIRKSSNMKIPIVIYSNLSDSGSVQKALGLGAKAYFKKVECPPKELAEKVSVLIEKK